MKPFLWSLIVPLAALVAACAPAAAPPAPAPSDWPAAESEIRAAIQESAESWNQGDLAGHLAIYVDSVTFMTDAGPRPGIEAVRESFDRTYFRDGRPMQDLSFREITVRPLGRDAALQTGRFVLAGGGQAEQSGWFTLVWIRTSEGWKAVHDHTS